MKTVIIDDEKQIREGLKILLSQIDSIEVIAEASTISEAVQIIEDIQPDLVLLDIQLKSKTGFDMLELLPPLLNFKLIFITAYSEYAIKAFKYNAFDYLLKPIDPDELQNTIARLMQQNNNRNNQLELLKENKNLEKIIIKTTDQIYKLPLNEILRCEADQGYTHFYMKDGKHILSSKTLKEYNNLLPNEQFIRVHQSHLVNWDYVISYNNKKGVLIIQNEQKVPVSFRKRHLVMELLKK